MSFFSDLMSSVTGQPAQPLAPLPKRTPSPVKKPDTAPTAASINAGAGASDTKTVPALKRKADVEASESTKRTAMGSVSASKTGKARVPAPAVPQARASTSTTSSTTKTGATPKTTASKPGNTDTAPKPTAAPVRAVASAVPAAGSYQAMLARAAEAHKTQTHVWEIKHVPKDKRSRQHIRRADALAKANAAAKDPKSANTKAVSKNGAIRGSTSTQRTGSPSVRQAAHPVKSTVKIPAKVVKKPREPLEYKGTMGLKPSDPSRRLSTTDRRMIAYRARRKSEEEAEAAAERFSQTGISDPDDPDSYSDEPMESIESDEGSDESMIGGGFDELEAEEEKSLQAAKKEDAVALMQEEQRKKEKEERKKKLQALAAKTKAPRF